jgi:hypothetical protein
VCWGIFRGALKLPSDIKPSSACKQDWRGAGGVWGRSWILTLFSSLCVFLEVLGSRLLIPLDLACSGNRLCEESITAVHMGPRALQLAGETPCRADPWVLR